MSFDKRIVQFHRSSSFIHSKAMTNRRDGKSVEALELLRQASEHSPENTEYRLDLAEMYYEIGCNRRSIRVLLDSIADGVDSAECYYGIALNKTAENEFDSAKRAFDIYKKKCKSIPDDVFMLDTEIALARLGDKEVNRRDERVRRITNEACEALRDNNLRSAQRLFQKNMDSGCDTADNRIMYALAIALDGDLKKAGALADTCMQYVNNSIKVRCTAAQVYYICKQRDKAAQVMEPVMNMEPETDELRMISLTYGAIEIHEKAAEAARIALLEMPNDAELLHIRAVGLIRSGTSAQSVASIWKRILRIDDDDLIARYYYDAAVNCKLQLDEYEYIYALPDNEKKKCLGSLKKCLESGLEAVALQVSVDRDLRQMMYWLGESENAACSQIAMMSLAISEHPEALSMLRELLYRNSIAKETRQKVLSFLEACEINVSDVLPEIVRLELDAYDDEEKSLSGLSVGERQMLKFASDVLQEEYDMEACLQLRDLWVKYRNSIDIRHDPLNHTQEAAAALAWNYLLDQKMIPDPNRIVKQFECNRRRMTYYAGRIAAAIGRKEENNENS